MKNEKVQTERMEQENSDNLITQHQTSTINTEVDMHTSNEMDNANMVKAKDVAKINVQMIDVKAIDIKYHPRKNLGDIERLQNSIIRDSLQEPLLVYEAGDNRYAVIDGCRRLKAIQEFGWPTVPCIITKDIGKTEAAHLSYVKNKERNSFNPIEIALHLKSMRQEFGYSLRDLELKGYGSPPSISGKIKLLDLPEAIQKQIQDGELTATHAVALLKLKTPQEQENMSKKIVNDDLSVKQVKRKINKFVTKGQKVDKPPERQHPDTDIPDVYIKKGRDMCELTDESVHLVVGTLTSNHYDRETEKVKVKECARVLVPGGVMALQINENAGRNAPSQLDLRGPKHQNYLRKLNVFLSNLIIIQAPIDPSKKIDCYARHTSYEIVANYTMVYVFRKEGQREVPAKDVVQKSTLTEDERLSWLIGIWDVGQPRIFKDDDLHSEEVCRRLIRLYSYEGDTVLDPWLRSGTTIKVARDLNRKGIGYEVNPHYKPIIMKKLGLELKKPTPELITNMTPEKVQAILSEPEDERQELPESHQVWVPSGNQPHKVMKADTP